jgi:serine/threonine-protein kinase
VDARSDLYSLGIIAYEMLSGRLPFDAKTDYEWVKAQTTQDPDFSGLSDRVGRSVVQFLRRVLEKSPAKRFASAQEMDTALDALKESSRPSLPSLGIPGVVQDTAASLSAVTQKSSGLLALAKENLVLVVAGAMVMMGLGFVALTHFQGPSAPALANNPSSSAPVSTPATTTPTSRQPAQTPTPSPQVATPENTPRPVNSSPPVIGEKRISIGTEGGERPMSTDAPVASPAPQTSPAEKPARPKGNYDFKF